MIMYFAYHPSLIPSIILHKQAYYCDSKAVIMIDEKHYKHCNMYEAMYRLKENGIFKEIIPCSLQCNKTLEYCQDDYEQYIINYYNDIFKKIEYTINDFKEIYGAHDGWDGAGFLLYLNIIKVKYNFLNLSANTWNIWPTIPGASKEYISLLKNVYKADSPLAEYAYPVIRVDSSEQFRNSLKKEFGIWDKVIAFKNFDSMFLNKIFLSFYAKNINEKTDLIILNSIGYMAGCVSAKIKEKISQYSISSIIVQADMVKKIADYFLNGNKKITVKMHITTKFDQKDCDLLCGDEFIPAGNMPFEFYKYYCLTNNIRFDTVVGVSSTSNEYLDDKICDNQVILGHHYNGTWFFYDSIYAISKIANICNKTIFTDNITELQFKNFDKYTDLKVDTQKINYLNKCDINNNGITVVDCLKIGNESNALERIINNIGRNKNIIFINLQYTELYFEELSIKHILKINLNKEFVSYDYPNSLHDEVIYVYCSEYDFYRKMRVFYHERMMKYQGYILKISVSDAMCDLNNRRLLLMNNKTEVYVKEKNIENKFSLDNVYEELMKIIKKNNFALMEHSVYEVIKKYTTARIDVVIEGNNAKLEILNISDTAINKEVAWSNEQGMGYILESSVLKLDFTIKAITSGLVKVILRGIEFKDGKENEKLIPYWIDYKSIVVNGQEQLQEVKPAWFGDFPVLSGNAIPGNIFNLHIEWEPHRDNRVKI